MTRAQRFAREWLWWVCGAMICVVVTLFSSSVDSQEPPLVGLVIGLAMSVALYLVIGAVRLTLWALAQVKRTDQRG